jgi:hypothetical protein
MTDQITKSQSVSPNRLMSLIAVYRKEINYMNVYLMITGSGLLIIYSMFFFLDLDTITRIGQEDQLIEWLTCLFFFAASVFYSITFIRSRNLVFLIVALVFFFGAGEEISWGQRLLGFHTPESLYNVNVQREFNLHNIAIINNRNFDGSLKHGIYKLLNINFLFKLSTLIAGIALPFCVYHTKFISGITTKLKIPVPPISIGIFFLLSWVIYQYISKFILPDDVSFECFDATQETFELAESFILMMISIFFFTRHKEMVPGKDIKQVI